MCFHENTSCDISRVFLPSSLFVFTSNHFPLMYFHILRSSLLKLTFQVSLLIRLFRVTQFFFFFETLFYVANYKLWFLVEKADIEFFKKVLIS